MAAKKISSKSKKVLTSVFSVLCAVLLCLGGLFAYYAYQSSPAVPALSRSSENSSSNANSSNIVAPAPARSNTENTVVITLQFGSQFEKITSNMIASWQSKDANGKTVWNGSALSKYAKGLAEKYSNFTPYVSFSDHNGEECSVINKSTGWLLDESKTADYLKKIISDHTQVNIIMTDRKADTAALWTRIAADYDIAKAQNGKAYIEVSIDDQYMWVIQNGSVIAESPVITGNPYTGHDTPIGSYFISSKESPAVLYGEDYETEVSYWMGFNYDIGFHDAVWQYYFGGDAYYYNGSHGCVNLPLDFAEKLFSLTYLYMPVYVH